MGRMHAPQAGMVLLVFIIICMHVTCSTTPCHAFQSTAGSRSSPRSRTPSGLSIRPPRLAQSADTTSASDSSMTSSDTANATSSNESAVDWTRADTSTQIFPGGPGMLGAQEQSGYFTSAPYSRTLSYAKQKQKRTRELRRQMNKRRRRPRPATVAGRMAALFNKLRGRTSTSSSNESTENDGGMKMEDEDGYDLMYGTKQNKARHWLRHDGNAYYHNYEPRWKRLGKFVFRRNERQVEPGQLILVRHGESQWNANKVRYRACMYELMVRNHVRHAWLNGLDII